MGLLVIFGGAFGADFAVVERHTAEHMLNSIPGDVVLCFRINNLPFEDA